MKTNKSHNQIPSDLKNQTEASRPRPTLQDKLITLFLAGCVVLLVLVLPDRDTPIPAAHAAAKRNSIPNFTFPALAGKSWTLTEHRGHVVLINFWATWCPPCQQETPELVEISNMYRAKGLDVVGVSMDNSDLDSVRAFASRYGIPYPILLPTPGSPIPSSVQAYPTTLLIDCQGRVAVGFEGALDAKSIKPVLEGLLKEPAGNPMTPNHA